MASKRIHARKKRVLELVLIIGIVCPTLGTRAQSAYPWVWWQGNPTIRRPFKCSVPHVVRLDSFPFFVGCYDIANGDPINCHQSWQEYFSVEGVPHDALLYWQGGHVHARSGDISTTTGGLYCDLSSATDGSGFEGDTRNQFWTAYKWVPQGSQVVRVTAHAKDITPGYFVNADDAWHLDPADTTRKSAILELAFDVRLQGLVALPPDPANFVFERGRTGTHPQASFVTPVMASKLERLAVTYRSAYLGCTGGTVAVKLSFNDMSLAWGGLFDFNGTWDCPHTLHRTGTSADVNHDGPRDAGGRQATDEDLLDFVAKFTCGLKRYEWPYLIHYELAG